MKIFVLLLSCLLVQSKTLHKRYINVGNFPQSYQQQNEIGDQRWAQQWPPQLNQRVMYVNPPQPIQENANWINSGTSKSRNQRTIGRDPIQENQLAMLENFRQSLKNARETYGQMRHDGKLAMNPNIYVDNSKREIVTQSTTALPTATTEQVKNVARPFERSLENNSQIIPQNNENFNPGNVIVSSLVTESNVINSTEQTWTTKPSTTDNSSSESESNESDKSIKENEVVSNSTETANNLDPLHQSLTNTKSKSSRSVMNDEVRTLEQVRQLINRYRQKVQFLHEKKQDIRKFFDAKNLTDDEYEEFVDDLKQKGFLAEPSSRSLTSDAIKLRGMLTNLSEIVTNEAIKQQLEINELQVCVDEFLSKKNRTEEEQTLRDELQKLQIDLNDVMDDKFAPKQRASAENLKTAPSESKLDQLNREMHDLEIENRMRQHELMLEKLELQIQKLTPPKLLPAVFETTNAKVEALTSDLAKQHQPNLQSVDERIAHLEQLIKHMTIPQGRTLNNGEQTEKEKKIDMLTPKRRQGYLDKQHQLEDLLVNIENAPHNLLVSEEVKTNQVLSRLGKPQVFQLPFCLQPVNQPDLKPVNESPKYEYVINQGEQLNKNPSPDSLNFKQIYRRSNLKENTPSLREQLQLLEQKFGVRRKRSIDDETEENAIESVKQRIADLKSQLENSNFTDEFPFDFDQNFFRSAYDYSAPGISPSQGYHIRKVQKFDDLFIKIIKFLLHKLEISTPYIIDSLFNGDSYYYVKDYEPVNSYSGYSNANTNYRKSEENPTKKSAVNEIQGTGRSGILSEGFQGLLGFLPAILLNLLSNFSSFLNVLKQNKFLKNFVIPGAAILVVDGVIAMLVWWLSAPEDGQNPISLLSDLLNTTFTRNFS